MKKQDIPPPLRISPGLKVSEKSAAVVIGGSIPSVEGSKNIVNSSVKRKKYKRRTPQQVFETDIELLNLVCNKLGMSKSQAYKTSLRLLAVQFNIVKK